MKGKITISFLIPLFILFCSGCVPLIIGGAAGALGAYAISKDTVQGETDLAYAKLWNSALTLAKFRGAATKEDSASGAIEFKSDSGRVWIKLFRLTESTTRLRVSVRKYHLPNLTLAQDIFVKIMENARNESAR